jgi:hypothetical protein
MGFQKPKKIFVITFEEGSPYHGLTMRTTSTSAGKLLSLMELINWGDGERKFDSEDKEKVHDLFKMFADCIKSWNMEDEGVPVPPTTDGLLSLDMETVMDLMEEWMDLMVKPSAPLGQKSTDGTSPPEESIPMEIS